MGSTTQTPAVTHALAGGPGQPPLPFTEAFDELLGPIAATRDLIVFDQRGMAECFLARILWLQGFADDAMRHVKGIIDRAATGNDVLSLCQALVQAGCPVAFLVGDLTAAERYVTMLIEQSARVEQAREQDERRSRHASDLDLVTELDGAVGRNAEEGLGRRRGVRQRDEEIAPPAAEP